MTKLIITTVGTSLLDKKIHAGFNKWINMRQQNQIPQLFKKEAPAQQKYEEHVMEYFLKMTRRKDYTAEIASLKLMEINKEEDRVVLLASDTFSGVFCALMNQFYINENIALCEPGNGDDKDLRIIKGLEAKEASRFVDGLNNLSDLLWEFDAEAAKQGRELIFNITGGYKGIIPFIAFYARAHRKKIYYGYEESELIEILPNLKVTSSNEKGQKTNEATYQGGLQK